MWIQPSQELGPIQTIEIEDWAAWSGKKRYLGNEAHVWSLSRNHFHPRLRQFHSYLSLWEQKKALSFSYAKDREDFTLGRGALRHILSQYTGCHPKDIEITNNRFGKPFLGGVYNDLGFNVAQSANRQVFVVSRSRLVGIDIELIDPDVKMNELMTQNFSAMEIEGILSLPQPVQIHGFYKTWTQKEAYMKARGLGYELSSKLSVSMSIRAGRWVSSLRKKKKV